MRSPAKMQITIKTLYRKGIMDPERDNEVCSCAWHLRPVCHLVCHLPFAAGLPFTAVPNYFPHMDFPLDPPLHERHDFANGS
jgi:hypothetical protein